jgi:hypothetical protein
MRNGEDQTFGSVTDESVSVLFVYAADDIEWEKGTGGETLEDL